MTVIGAFLGLLAFLWVAANELLKKVEKRSRKFPWCKTCGVNMTAVGLPMFMPGEVLNHLGKHNLPTHAASRFICPKGHYLLWFVPRFGNAEPFFFREEL